MASRIRYTEKNPGVFISKQTFKSQTTGAEYKIHLDTNNMIYKIQNMRELRFVSIGGENINNLNVLKRVAKRKLMDLGVNFNSEYRDRTFGLCNKGYTQEKHMETGNER